MHLYFSRFFSLLPLILIFLSFSPTYSQHPKPGAQFETYRSQGIWTWYGEPKAVYYKDTKEKTYIAYLDITNQSTHISKVMVTSYDHQTGKIDTSIINPNFGWDDHNHPSVMVRNDGKIMVFYCQHNGTAMHLKISTNPEDISSWGPDKEILKQSGTYTYANILQLSGENNRIYCFYRGLDWKPTFATSDDGGNTWSAETKFFTVTGTNTNRPYIKYETDGTAIHMIIEKSNRNDGALPSYYLCYKNNGFYRSNGTLIKTLAQVKTAPLTVSDVEMVFDPANPKLDADPALKNLKGSCWDIALGKDGRPVFLFDIFDGDGKNHRYHYYRFNGTQWVRTFMVNSGGPMDESGSETGFAGGMTLDHLDPSIAYVSAQSGGQFELFRYATSDSGKTWQKTQMTANSGKNKNTRPCVPRGYTGGKVGVIWLCGTYYTYSDASYHDVFNTDIKMYTFDITPVNVTTFIGRTSSSSGLIANKNGISFSLANPKTATLRLYDIHGRLFIDCTAAVQRMGAGRNTLSFRNYNLVNGAYVVRLFDGAHDVFGKFPLTR
jgi:hypothetical protein